ncbi:MAG: hypothetical protein IH940_06790 [Acidobacteria bacterium]|nr:hypothetical protein [Acidobacteriota bacterium]
MATVDVEMSNDREWLAFEDEHGDSWMFDATMLTSNWRCIWNEGCPGIEAEPNAEALHGCCSHGAHFTGDEDRDRVLSAAKRLDPADWHNHSHAGDELTTDADGDEVTRTVDGVCIFHNPAGFEGGPGCALHTAATKRGESYIDWKPDVCWQLPLRLEHHVDDNGHGTYFLGEWARRNWGEGGDDLGWWCTEEIEAFVAHEPVYVTLRDELTAMVGERVYDHLANRLALDASVPVPHPVLRRP